MNSTDFPGIVGNQLSQKRSREKLAAKYKIGGKVKNRRGVTAASLKAKREALRAKYATGGTVPLTGATVAAPRDPNGFWARLQTEIKALNSNSQMPSAPGLPSHSSPDTAAQQVAAMQGGGQQPQPSAGMARGGRV